MMHVLRESRNIIANANKGHSYLPFTSNAELPDFPQLNAILISLPRQNRLEPPERVLNIRPGRGDVDANEVGRVLVEP